VGKHLSQELSLPDSPDLLDLPDQRRALSPGALSLNPHFHRRARKVLLPARVTSAAVSASHESSLGRPGLSRASITMGTGRRCGSARFRATARGCRRRARTV
jgi:hypothetical protein